MVNEFIHNDNEPFEQPIQHLHTQLSVLSDCLANLPLQHPPQVTDVLEETTIALDHLQLVFEEMQTSLEAAAAIETELLQQQQQITADYQHYYHLFDQSPNAYLIMKTNGLILQANQAAAKLLNMSPTNLVRMPFAHFMTGVGWQVFRTGLNRLLPEGRITPTPYHSVSDYSKQHAPTPWKITFQPNEGELFAGELELTIIHDRTTGEEQLLVSIHDISRFQSTMPTSAPIEPVTPITTLPRSLDGLRVLIVDDEADAREFVTAVLEAQGVEVTAVASAAQALQTLEHTRPDVLVCDIRMPDENGYSLIQKIRARETEEGWHIPAAALTAYLAEDRDKALAAGFETHLHKLAQPTELVAMVAELARRTSH